MTRRYKRKAALAGTRNGLARTSASDGSSLKATYPTFSLSATDFAAAVIADRCHLPAPLARLIVELAHLGGGPPS